MKVVSQTLKPGLHLIVPVVKGTGKVQKNSSDEISSNDPDNHENQVKTMLKQMLL